MSGVTRVPVSVVSGTIESSKEKQPAICVVAQRFPVADGLGDIFFAIKMYKILKNTFQGKADVLLVPNGQWEEKSFKQLMLDDSISITRSEEVAQRIQQGPSLIIHGPVLLEPLAIKEIPRTAQIWNIHEYSWPQRTRTHLTGSILCSGLGEKELGIFCDEKLYSSMKRLEAEGRESDLIRVQAIKHSYIQKLMEERVDNDLFFAYSHRAQAVFEFITTFLEIEGAKDKNLSFIITGCSHEGVSERILRRIKPEFLKKNNIRLITMYDGEKENIITDISYGNGNGKKVSCVCCPHLSHDDFVLLLQSSRPEVLITGDQSLSEALSLGKVIVYDAPHHKAYLRDNLILLAEEAKSEIAQHFLVGVKNSNYRDILHKVRGELIQEFRKIAHYVMKHYNLGENLKQKTARWFLSLADKE